MFVEDQTVCRAWGKRVQEKTLETSRSYKNKSRLKRKPALVVIGK